MKPSCIVLTLFCCLILSPLSAEWNIPLSSTAKDGSLRFLNETLVKEPFGGPLPQGPSAFRIHQNQAWLLDSLSGCLSWFDATGTLINSAQIASTVSFERLGDLALIIDGDKVQGLWITDRHQQKIFRCDAHGAISQTIGGLGNASAAFLDLTRIETGPAGKLYAFDLGRSAVVTFDSTGKPGPEYPGVNAGFFLDRQETLYLGTWDQESGRLRLSVQKSDGSTPRQIVTDITTEVQPTLWMQTEANELLVAWPNGDQPAGWWKLARLSPEGQTIAVLDLQTPQNMVRPVCLDDTGKAWSAVADFDTAPKSAFEIKAINLGATPEG